MTLAWVGWHVAPCMVTSVLGPIAAIFSLLIAATAGPGRLLGVCCAVAIATSAFAASIFWLIAPEAISDEWLPGKWPGLAVGFVVSHGPAVSAVAAIFWWRYQRRMVGATP
ncbi:MAG: hypothetical protein AAGB29_14785 [Planctomycetota bacterium]